MSERKPRAKLARRLGTPTSPKVARILEHKPGQDGRGRRRRQSDFAKQLLEKQRLRAQYNLSETTLRNIFDEARKSSGNTAVRLMEMLEARLDRAVYRAGFAPTMYAARQAVAHGHVAVNGRKTDRIGFQLSPGDVFGVRPESRDLLIFKDREPSQPPEHMQVDKANLTATYLRTPAMSETPMYSELSEVIEYYSRFSA
jgi:small subunit ribosomal protein S4